MESLGKPDGWRAQGNILSFNRRWQEPAKTEKHAYERLLAENAPGDSWIYVAFPWASLIDGIERNVELGTQLDGALKRLDLPVDGRRLITVCQHVKFRDYIDRFVDFGITDIFASHAERGEKCFRGVNIHPFPLFPVQAENPVVSPSRADLDVGAFFDRQYLYSFVGAFDSTYYSTQARAWVFELPAHPRAHLVRRAQWHFERRVYGSQVYGRSLTKCEEIEERHAGTEFVQSLVKTQFSLCPSGAGPNSIRLWESIEFGCIPVIIADNLALPGDMGLWREACVFASETEEDVQALPERLAYLSRDKELIAQKLSAVRQLRDLYGKHRFTHSLESFVSRLDRETSFGQDDRALRFYLDARRISQPAVPLWKDFLHSVAAKAGRRAEIYQEHESDKDKSHLSASILDIHDWVNEDLVHVSDSRSLSCSLVGRFEKFYVHPSSTPDGANIELALRREWDTSSEDPFVGFEEEWSPICTVITSVYNGDRYIRGFLSNCEKFERYADIEHFLVLAGTGGHEYVDVLHHTRNNPSVVFVWLSEDPGLYEVWNNCAHIASSRYISNANIDDRRSPRQICELVELLDANKDCDVASAGLRVTDDPDVAWECSEGLKEWYVAPDIERNSGKDLFKIKDGRPICYNFPHCMPIWRAGLVAVNGKFREDEFGPSADWEYWLRAGQRGAAFVRRGEALGLYYRAPMSYRHRNQDSQSYDDRILGLYVDETASLRSRGRELSRLQIARMFEARESGQHFEFLVCYFRLVQDLRSGVCGGEKLRDLLRYVGESFFGVPDPFGCSVYGAAGTLKPAEEVSGSLDFLLNVVHAWKTIEPSAVETVCDIAIDFFRKTLDLRGLLILALLKRMRGERDAETRFLRRAYERNAIEFYAQLNSVYRFRATLREIVGRIVKTPPYVKGNLFDGARRVFYFPDYTHGNPYQRLFYESARRRGVEVVGVREDQFGALVEGRLGLGRKDVIHLHWLNCLFKNVAADKQGCVANRFLRDVRFLKSKSVQVHWTVHNLYCNEELDRGMERGFQNALSREVDKIYVHHPIVLGELGEWLDCTDNVEFLEHGSYIGACEDEIAAAVARRELGLDQNDFVLGVVGQVRPYKILFQYLPDLNEAMRENGRIKLIVAGKISCDLTKEGLSHLPGNQVIVVDEFISDSDLQLYLRACSVGLLTYRHILTSGSLFQFFSFSRPVLAPNKGSIRAYVVDGYNGFMYSGSDFARRLNGFSRMEGADLERMGRNARMTAGTLSWPSS